MLGVGVFGAGYWAQNMLRVISDAKACRLLTVCDIDAKQLESVSARYPDTRTTSNGADILQDPDVDVVYIVTPPSTHAELAIAALHAGKHVLVEKPLAVTTAESEAMIAAARTAQRTLMVGHTFLYSPPVTKIKELIDDGTIGDVFYVDSQRVNLGKYQASGVMWDLAPHDLSIMLHWLGQIPTSVSATGRSFRSTGREDVAFLTFDFPNGVVAQLHVSWLAPVKLRRTMISGSQRMVTYDDTAGPEAVKVFNHGVDLPAPQTFGEFQLSYRQGDVLIPRLDTAEPLRAEWEHFLHCVETGETPRSSAEQGLAVVKVLETADRALQSGHRETVDLAPARQRSPRPRFGVPAPLSPVG